MLEFGVRKGLLIKKVLTWKMGTLILKSIFKEYWVQERENGRGCSIITQAPSGIPLLVSLCKVGTISLKVLGTAGLIEIELGDGTFYSVTLLERLGGILDRTWLKELNSILWLGWQALVWENTLSCWAPGRGTLNSGSIVHTPSLKVLCPLTVMRRLTGHHWNGYSVL